MDYHHDNDTAIAVTAEERTTYCVEVGGVMSQVAHLYRQLLKLCRQYVSLG